MRMMIVAILLVWPFTLTLALGADPYHFLYIQGSDLPPSAIFPGVNFEASADSPNDVPPAEKKAGRQDVRMEHYKDWLNSLETNKSRTFSLMLFCRELTEEESKYVSRLYSAFERFSHYIGETNTAVWIGPRRPPSFDLKSGKDLCDSFQLNYNQGPYVLYYRIKHASTTSYDMAVPYLPGVQIETEYVVMDLHRILVGRIPHLLNSLESYIRNGLEINKIRGPLAFEVAAQWFFSFGEKYRDDLSGIVSGIKKGRASFELKWGSIS